MPSRKGISEFHPQGGSLSAHPRLRVTPAPRCSAAGNLTAFDYRERAPLRATRTMYLGADGEIDRSLTASGYLAPGVPGTVRGLALAHRKYGKLPWRELVMPSVRLAERGFEMTES